MSTSAASRCRRLLEAVRSLPLSTNQLPCFPLHPHHVTTKLSSSGGAPTPRDFHERLCHMIRNAKYRVHLASLYVGTGSGGVKEKEFLRALGSVDTSKVQVSILLDENRATRRVKHTSDIQGTTSSSSADAVHECIQSQKTSSDCGLFLFPALPEPRRSLLPSPLNEIAGVFHMKVSIHAHDFKSVYNTKRRLSCVHCFRHILSMTSLSCLGPTFLRNISVIDRIDICFLPMVVEVLLTFTSSLYKSCVNTDIDINLRKPRG